MNFRMRDLSTVAVLSAGVLLSACSKEPTTFVPNQVDTYTIDNVDFYTQAQKLLQADYLFVFDVGYSMFDNRTLLQDAFVSFGNLLASQNIDYRIGLVNGNVHGYPNNAYGELSSSFMGGSAITPANGELSTQLLNQIIPVGLPLNENSEMLLASARKVLNSNRSFIRTGSSLVVVYISNEDDQSANFKDGSPTNIEASIQAQDPSSGVTPQDFANHMKSLIDPSFLKGRAVINYAGGCDAVYPDTNGVRLAETPAAIDADLNTPSQVSTCIDNSFESFLRDLATDATNVSKPLDKFSLQTTSYDPSSIRVFVNGSLQTLGTHYDISNNVVVFRAAHIPTYDAQVIIEYSSRYVLSGQPSVDSIVVTLDGTTVPQSSSDGWSFNASNNSIQLNGSFAQSNDSELRVSYTLK